MSFSSICGSLRNIYFFVFILLIISLYVLCRSSFLYSIALVSEFLVFGILLSPKNKISKIFIIFFSICLSLQVTSISVIGDYVPSLLFSNLRNYRDIGHQAVYSVILFAIFFFVNFYVLNALSNIFYKKYLSYIMKSCIALIFLFIFNYFVCGTPILSLGKTLNEFISALYYHSSEADKSIQHYIYHKNYVYKSENIVEEVPDLRKFNVIVLFTEGFSSIEIDQINHLYENLTPNLNELMGHSLYFDNYFNHTAATYRGIRGQLSSSYQYSGGYNQNKSGIAEIGYDALKRKFRHTIVSLIDVLNNQGYTTYFLSAHPRREPLNTMLENLGIYKVFKSDDFKKESVDFTDQELYSHLTDLVLNNKLKEPFFIATYNIGTHLGKDSPDKRYGDGNNSYLNTIYNYDDAFGKFWKVYKKSSLSKHTILILTSDHAAYPSKEFLETFHLDKSKHSFFVNKIPLAIYYDGVEPKKLDAHGKNSLDLVPTILNMLRINNVDNYFLGCSLFGNKCKYDFEYISNIGDEYYSTKNSLCVHIRPVKSIKNFYSLSEN